MFRSLSEKEGIQVGTHRDRDSNVLFYCLLENVTLTRRSDDFRVSFLFFRQWWNRGFRVTNSNNTVQNVFRDISKHRGMGNENDGHTSQLRDGYLLSFQKECVERRMRGDSGRKFGFGSFVFGVEAKETSSKTLRQSSQQQPLLYFTKTLCMSALIYGKVGLTLSVLIVAFFSHPTKEKISN